MKTVKVTFTALLPVTVEVVTIVEDELPLSGAIRRVNYHVQTNTPPLWRPTGEKARDIQITNAVQEDT